MRSIFLKKKLQHSIKCSKVITKQRARIRMQFIQAILPASKKFKKNQQTEERIEQQIRCIELKSERKKAK